MEYYLECLRKYAVFTGRSRRKEYWYFVLFNFLVLIVLSVVDRILGLTSPDTGVGLLRAIYSLGTIVPGLAAATRRLHDTGRSGWWIFLCFIPVVGAIILIVFLASESQSETNEYG
jgi:uncharacterized membrane protein YhaH (DUF805 family)